MVNYEKIKYNTTKSMNKTSTYRGTSQRAGLGGNRYEGLYGMDLGDARWKSDSSSCSRNSALKGRVSRAYLISHYQSRLCFPYRRMSQTGWQIFSIMWEYLLFYIKFEGLRTGVAPRYLFIRPRRRSLSAPGILYFVGNQNQREPGWRKGRVLWEK